MQKDVVLSLRMKCLGAILSCDTVHYDAQSELLKILSGKKPKEWPFVISVLHANEFTHNFFLNQLYLS